VRKGLLFAGTEGSVFVSFDDGDHWQPLQLNLPHTSMRDLAIHGDDLIVGTHGRSFWILDDITPLRELSVEIAKAPVTLYKPQEAIRFRWNRNTDTPLPPDIPAGKNPPDGAILDYYLGSASSKPVTLEILDADDHLVRRYSNTDKPEPLEKIAAANPIPMYWVRHQQILSAEAGMHRFVWDTHYPPPDALNREFPISAIVHDTPQLPVGAWAMPGKYTVRLIVDGKTYTQPLTVRMDPRVKTSDTDLRKQFEMEAGIVEGMNETFEALQQVRALRPQVTDRAGKAKGALADSLTALDKQTAELEGASQAAFFGVPPSGKRPENLSTLNQHLGQLLNVVDSADAAPTTQASAVYLELEDALGKLLAQWKKVRDSDLPALNASLKKAHLEEVNSNKRLAAPSGGSDEDDEP
jgi:hypothetical protein